MFDISSILTPQATRAGVDAQSRKRVLEIASDVLAEAHPNLSGRALFDELMSRERLGSTALGEGVAIPHCRTDCERIHAAFLRLAEPVDYDAPDDEPVDLLFVLIVPPGEQSAHLEILATLARLFAEPDHRRRLREQTTGEALYQTIGELVSNQAA